MAMITSDELSTITGNIAMIQECLYDREYRENIAYAGGEIAVTQSDKDDALTRINDSLTSLKAEVAALDPLV